MENECRSCYRPVREGSLLCIRCASEKRTEALSPPLMLAGGAALATLVAGTLSLDIRLCIAGAVIAGIAIVVHLVQSVR